MSVTDHHCMATTTAILQSYSCSICSALLRVGLEEEPELSHDAGTPVLRDAEIRQVLGVDALVASSGSAALSVSSNSRRTFALAIRAAVGSFSGSVPLCTTSDAGSGDGRTDVPFSSTGRTACGTGRLTVSSGSLSESLSESESLEDELPESLLELGLLPGSQAFSRETIGEAFRIATGEMPPQMSMSSLSSSGV